MFNRQRTFCDMQPFLSLNAILLIRKSIFTRHLRSLFNYVTEQTNNE